MCKNGNIEMINFLHKSKLSNINSNIPMIEAAKYSNSNINIFLNQNSYKISSSVMEWAAL